jgi:hypothetical protein
MRWVLAPRTAWQARHLAADFGEGIDARTAWVTARRAGSSAYLQFTTRPWPDAEPGDPETLMRFTEDEETRRQAARLVVPVRSLRT